MQIQLALRAFDPFASGAFAPASLAAIILGCNVGIDKYTAHRRAAILLKQPPTEPLSEIASVDATDFLALCKAFPNVLFPSK